MGVCWYFTRAEVYVKLRKVKSLEKLLIKSGFVSEAFSWDSSSLAECITVGFSAEVGFTQCKASAAQKIVMAYLLFCYFPVWSTQ